MFNDIGTKDNRFGMLVSDPTTGKPCKYGAVMEVNSYCRIVLFCSILFDFILATVVVD